MKTDKNLPNQMMVRFTAILVVSVVVCGWQSASGAGRCAGTPISAASVDTVGGGTWSCNIYNEADKVEMVASAIDFDSSDSEAGCSCGTEGENRIDSAATAWVVSSGYLDASAGEENAWKADSSTGHKTLSVTFKDFSGVAECDDDDKEVQKTLTAFRVGVHLAVSGRYGSSFTRWENEPWGDAPYMGFLILDDGDDEGPMRITASGTDSESAESSQHIAATWTLVCEPNATPIKKYIHAGCRVYGGSSDAYGIDAKVYGKTTDTDSDGQGPWSRLGIVDVTVAGVVSFDSDMGTEGDETVAVLASGVGFSSTLNGTYKQEVALVSQYEDGPTDTKQISYSPDDAYLTGKADAQAHAMWRTAYAMQAVSDNEKTATAETLIRMYFEFGITDYNPYYGN